MARVEKKKAKMLDAAYAHLDWAEESMLATGLAPNDHNLALVNTRVALASSWIALAKETTP